MNSSTFPNTLNEINSAAETLKFLSNPKLLLILCRLGEQEITAGELAKLVDMTPSALSQHLKRLRDKGIVTTRREHRHLYYHLADDNTRKIISLLHVLYCKNDKF